MRCPRCNKALVEHQTEGRRVCPGCGWAARETAHARVDGSGGSGRAAGAGGAVPAWWALGLGWVFSVVLLVGPYVAMVTLLPRWPDWLPLVYGLVMVVYLMGAAAVELEVDRHNLGWAGGLIDNPFSFQDDFERKKLGVMLLLLPGKVVVATLAGTWRALRGLGS